MRVTCSRSDRMCPARNFVTKANAIASLWDKAGVKHQDRITCRLARLFIQADAYCQHVAFKII